MLRQLNLMCRGVIHPFPAIIHARFVLQRQGQALYSFIAGILVDIYPMTTEIFHQEVIVGWIISSYKKWCQGGATSTTMVFTTPSLSRWLNTAYPVVADLLF